MATVEVCLSPALLNLYDLGHSNVVVTDVLRATSTMVTGADLLVKEIIPVSSVDEALDHVGSANTLVAGERNGVKVERFDLGNSPLLWKEHSELLKGKTMVMTTTNGTKAINMALGADKVYIGAFLNLDAVCEQLKKDGKNVLVLCAGWKNRVNMEDSLFAGAVAQRLATEFEIYGDAAIMAKQLYEADRHDLFSAIKGATHFKRLAHHGVEDDIRHCMKENESSVVPFYKDGAIVV